MANIRVIRSFLAVSCLALGLALSASANLVFERQTDISGTGIGSQLTVLTIQSTGSESGCVTWNGSADVVGGCSAPFDGADEKTGNSQTQTRSVAETGIADARDMRIMFNPNENDSAVTLIDMVATFYLANGTVVHAAPIDPTVGCTDAPGDATPATPCEFNSALIGGTGSAGLMFRLDAAQALILNNANFFATGTNRIGLAAAATGTAAGGEVFFVANFTDSDLSISKTCPRDILTCEEGDLPIALAYEIHVSNAGPTAAASVLVTDTLPANTTFIGAVWSYDDGGPDVPCTELNGVVTCDIDFLGRPTDPEANNAEATIVILVTADACGLTYNNIASISTTSVDPDSANNTDSCSTVIGTPPDADLSISKTGPATVTDENNITYTLTVSNIDNVTDPGDPDVAVGVMVTDTLPAGLEFVSAVASNDPTGTCGEAAGLITCSLGDMAPGTSLTITVVATAHNLGLVTNCAQVFGSTDDPNATNDESCFDTTVQGADLTITKTDSPDPVVVSGSLVYTVTVHNNGPATATNAVVTDTLPGNVMFVSAPGCTNNAGVLTCNIASLANGADQIFTITVTVPGSPGNICNDVSVTSETGDPTPGNNSDQECTDVTAQADLSIDKTCAATAVQGTTGSYTITVSNAGPGAATSVVVTDTLPAGVSLNGPLPDGCSGTSTITCNLGTIASAANGVVTINVSFDGFGAQNNTASVTSAVVDPVPGNNSDSCSTTVQGADLSIVKSGNDIAIGDNMVYTLAVTNNGTITATSVVVTDTLPGGVTFVSAPGCTQDAGVVTCNIASLASSASQNFTITVTPLAVGSICNTATVTASQPDPNLANNTDEVCTEVRDARQIPTSSELGLMLMAMLLAGAAVFRMRA